MSLNELRLGFDYPILGLLNNQEFQNYYKRPFSKHILTQKQQKIESANQNEDFENEFVKHSNTDVAKFSAAYQVSANLLFIQFLLIKLQI